MAIIQPVITNIAGDNPVDERLIGWYRINGGDTCEPVQAWAWHFQSWQLTGYAQGGLITNPNVPVMPDRAIDIHGSNDGTCFGLLFTFAVDVAGMASRMGDPIRNGNDEQRFIWILPVVRGTANPMGPDCSLMLFQAREWGPRA